MKILILHQPFPMGNYKLNPYIGKHLKSQGHEVYLVQQLNGAPLHEEFVNQIQNQNFDLIYYEMLDQNSFELVSRIKGANKVLLYASKGIFKDFEDIINYKDKYYNNIITNSKFMANKFSENNINNRYFSYYPAPITENEIVNNPNYKHDCVYLGGGYQRLSKEEYKIEQEIIYSNPEVQIYGAGWPQQSNYRGVLPPEDIASLYSNSKSSIGTIEPSQRTMGMINNRYSEMFKTGNKIISIKYPEIDFDGGEEFITFVSNKNELSKAIFDIDPKVKQKQKEFILDKESEFFNTLNSII